MTSEANQDRKPEEKRKGCEGRPIIVAGIGASALDPLKRLFSGLPLGHGTAFVLVPAASTEKLSIESLQEITPFPVVETQDGMPVLSDRIHVMPPGRMLNITGGILAFHEPAECTGLPMPIDHFFCSLGVDQGPCALGILLSGTASDGIMGLSQIRAKGGKAFIEDGGGEFSEAAQRAIQSEAVDAVLPAESMAEAIVVFAEQTLARIRSGPASSESGADLDGILEILLERAGHDFRCYKTSTLVRRTRRRMALAKISAFSDYNRFLSEHPHEVTLLKKDLLIGVTEFFRQPKAWKVLAEKVVSPLLENAGLESGIRFWVPGCSTGKEVYSLAMLFSEQIEKTGKKVPIHIFATDSDLAALAIARSGSYLEEDLGENVSPERRKRFFTYLEGRWQIVKEIREQVVFAPQNLTTDPPFSKLDLISCRNLLIYIEPDVQKKVIDLFHFALREGGFLFLGSAETIGDREDLFTPVSKKMRIYRRIGVSRRIGIEIPVRPTALRQPPGAAPLAVVPRSRMSLSSAAQQVLLDRFSPACVMIDRKFHVLYVHGQVEDFLTIPRGELTTRVVEMAREGLRARLGAAIGKCLETNRPVSATARVRRGEKSVPVKAVVIPLHHPREADGLLLITFEDYLPSTQKPRRKTGQEENVQQLEDELKVTREELQSTIEQLESSNDQLKASNEEVTAANEELQSANEELETSKEELQSLNEELNTINTRLQEKVEELETVNNDVVNLLSSTSIATAFLDKELRIKRYTPAATHLFSLIPSDLGRPVSDVLRRFEDDSLEDDSRRVLADLTPLAKEVRGEENRYYIRRITPYRTQDDRIEGVVVTFVDVSDLKQTEKALREAHRQAEQLARFPEENPNPIMRVSSRGRVLYRNPGAAELAGWTCAVGDPMPGPLLPMVDEAMAQGREVQGDVNLGGRYYSVAVAPFPAEGYANLYGRDITDRKRAEEALRKSEKRVRLKLEAILSPEGDIGKLDLADIIDTDAIQSLMDDFYKLAKIPMSIVDLEGKVLVGVGWQDICTKFHRAHPETCSHCIESDMRLSAGVPPGESKLYKCRNNMWDIATPILVGGKQMGNIFSGQFFFEGETLDYDFFHSQARRYGFDEKEYIAAMEAVPRLSRESVDTGMAFFMKLSEMISKLSYGNVKLARSLAQRDALTESLSESREDLNRAQAVAKTGSWRLDVIKNKLLWSDETYRIFEIPQETPLTYETFAAAVYPDDRAYVDRKWTAATNGEPYDIEHRILAGGAIKWVREKAELEFDKEGTLLGGFGTVQDITGRKQIEDALAHAKDQLENTLNSITSGYYALDDDWRFLEANRAAEEHFGMPRDRLIGRIIWEVTGTPSEAMVYRKFQEAMDRREPVHFEAASRIRPGFWSEMHLYPRDGLLEVYFTDISSRKRMEEELRRSKDDLEIRVQERTTELKRRAEQLSLLASELTLTEERERRRLAEILHDHLQQLLVGARLSLESISAHIPEDRQPTFKNVCNLLMESIETSRSLTAELSPPILYQRGLTAALEWLARWMLEKYELKVKLQVDQEIGIAQEDMMVLLFQSVRELLFNVVKHARVNAAEVRMFREDPEHLRIEVRDQGAGFDPGRMWEDGEHACGFGMFTIRERLELLGGRLEVESAPGKGASFTLIAPLGNAEPRQGRVQRKTAAAIGGTCGEEVTPSACSHKIEDRVRLVLVDDHIVMRQGLSIMLNAHPDIEIVAEAADGETAVQLARRLHPDVILMDISMPKMNGIEATRIIHSELPEIRIIGLSMFEDSDIASAVFEAGATAYLTKSGNTDGLLAAIREGRIGEEA